MSKEQNTKKDTTQAQRVDRMLKVTISGYYINSSKEKIDFDKVSGIIPWVDEEKGLASFHTRGRYAKKWISEAIDKDTGKPKYPERIEKIQQCFVDDIEETTGTLSFVGKNIKELTMDELQDLATAKDIRTIPLPKSGHSNRSMLALAYAGYCKYVLKRPLKPQPHEEGFNFTKLPNIILDDKRRVETARKITNDEVIEAAMRGTKVNYGEGKTSPEERFSPEELQMLADEAGIEYDESTTHAQLYKAVFGTAAA
jgi:hypothetical protein